MKKLLTTIIIIVLFFGLYKLTSSNPNIKGVDESNADIIIYWGEGCSHCENVKQYINDFKVDQKVKITLKEVYYNKTNKTDLEKTVALCKNVDTTQGIGVPLGYVPADNLCLSGDQPIIDWLQNK